MNNTIITTPEVRLFVTAVRERLVDLTEEEREELVGGLDADISDLVGERGVDALPEPSEYARELRTAAGFEPEMRAVRRGFRPLDRVTAVLDGAHGKWDALVSGIPGDPWNLVQVLRPAWWIVRAWVALELVDIFWGRGAGAFGLSLVPSLGAFGVPLLVVAVLVSIQIGRGKLWPGRPVGGPVGRLVLLVLNVVALAYLPIVVGQLASPVAMASYASQQTDSNGSYDQGYSDATDHYDRAGMYVDGHWVSNIYPYDAAGHPLVGVQLFDQIGQPVSVKSQTECVYSTPDQPIDNSVRAYYPWTTASGQAHNVFPVPSRVQDVSVPLSDPAAFSGRERPRVGQYPMASVPAAGLPGLLVSKAVTPRHAFTSGISARLPINAIDSGC